MKKRILMMASLGLALLLLVGCSTSKQQGLSGSYTAVNPPVESGEMVIQELSFTSDEVTMISGSVNQTVRYQIKEDSFLLITDYGTYSYAFEQKEDGSLVIDGVEYRQN